MVAPKVVMTIDLPDWLTDVSPLHELGVEFIKRQCNTEDEIISLAQGADGVICVFEPFTRRVIQKLSGCKVITVESVGYQGVDVNAATEFGICVANVPDYCTEEVSDHTIALVMALNRKLFQFDRIARDGRWGVTQWRTLMGPFARLRGQTMGIIGFGRIARALVPKAQCLGLKVAVCSSHLSPLQAQRLGVALVDMGDLLRQSDFVSVHASLTSDNRHLLGITQFRLMRPTAYLVNTSRGGLVDEHALLSALSDGLIAGAALDVTDPEPPSLQNPLFKLENVIITPHSAHFSDESLSDVRSRPAEEIARVLRGGWPVGLVNPDVKHRFIEKWGASNTIPKRT